MSLFRRRLHYTPLVVSPISSIDLVWRCQRVVPAIAVEKKTLQFTLAQLFLFPDMGTISHTGNQQINQAEQRLRPTLAHIESFTLKTSASVTGQSA